jgi:hypothetical protein
MSVLETPRLVFRGEATWDPITTNNLPPQYDEDTSKTVFDSTAAGVVAFRKAAIEAVTGGNWNPDGSHRSTFYDTSVVGVDTGMGLSADDPIVKCPVSFTGMLVDLEPYGNSSSQLFFDEMSFGIAGGCRVYAPRTTRMTARYINPFRNLKYKVIAGRASIVWQTSFPKSGGLRIDPHKSPTLEQFAKALQDDDVLGLTVRWSAYRTLYYDDPANMAALAKQLHDKLAGGGFQPNPARSQLVGVLGLWRKGEPPAEPGDRALLAQRQPPAPVVASAHVRLTADQLTLDLANSIPEDDVKLAKHDFGDLTAFAVAPDGKTVIATLGTFGYDAYRKEAYEASAGIITLKVDPAAAQKAQTADIQLRQKDGTVLLAETALRAVPITPNVYLDEGETAKLSVQVLERGRPASAGLDVVMSADGSASGITGTSKTDAQGIATFQLAGSAGDVEGFILTPGGTPVARNINPQTTTYVYVRTLAADADIAAMQPTWDNVHRYVLRNWQAMAPCMDNWLDLGNPDQVKSFAPMLHKLTAKENFEAFRFMPVTRDMTAGQRALLYAFLYGTKPLALAAESPPRESFRRLNRAMRGG